MSVSGQHAWICVYRVDNFTGFLPAQVNQVYCNEANLRNQRVLLLFTIFSLSSARFLSSSLFHPFRICCAYEPQGAHDGIQAICGQTNNF
ncbi:unnamed protein product [Protopolystoma xenopodis]|uniref:Uncharacterized protein n=1 Tax=Protopolystoma xenopodis TaxID=117903 RepID=A0A3S5A9T7_9PLAT|nr:unnamed protein product [Protopolystoma xenopodis]